MHPPKHVEDIYLQPGEFFFGDKETRISTLLGSCVSITLWHPGFRIGGMCHYMLPGKQYSGHGRDGRYADSALNMFIDEVYKNNTHPQDYQVKMFGGGRQYDQMAAMPHFEVCEKNIQAGRRLLTEYGFTVTTEHLGGNGYRNVIFDIWSGHVWVRHVVNSITGIRS